MVFFWRTGILLDHNAAVRDEAPSSPSREPVTWPTEVVFNLIPKVGETEGRRAPELAAQCPLQIGQADIHAIVDTGMGGVKLFVAVLDAVF
jgi:hypothetical protein